MQHWAPGVVQLDRTGTLGLNRLGFRFPLEAGRRLASS